VLEVNGRPYWTIFENHRRCEVEQAAEAAQLKSFGLIAERRGA
jgi:hypothetical protein